MSKLQITERVIGDQKPFAKIARTHSIKQFRQIADSISEFGFTSPVLIDGSDQIIAGHPSIPLSLFHHSP